MTKLPINYLSQIHDVVDLSWRTRSCTIVNLKMALDFLRADNVPAMDDLIHEGLSVGAYEEGIGWRHDGIVRLARNHCIPAYAQEFRCRLSAPASDPVNEVLTKKGIEKIERTLRAGTPVIVSVLPGFRLNRDNHTVLLIGIDEMSGELIYHDPYAKDSEQGASQFVSKEDFKKHWRRLAIFFD